MNCKFLVIFFLFLYSCASIDAEKSTKKIIPTEIYINKGFALLYSDDLKKNKLINKKIETRSLIIFQKNLKKGISVKVTNLLNNKSILAKVGNDAIYPSFYNSVLSKRIYEELDINSEEPYVEIASVLESSIFLAKKAKMYEEEKKVADKAPVDGIRISDLSPVKKQNKKKQKKGQFTYIIKIAEFYYENTAIMMKNRIKSELNLNNSKISEISDTNFRVYLGPFNDLKSLKKAFDDINPLNFENIEMIKQ